MYLLNLVDLLILRPQEGDPYHNKAGTGFKGEGSQKNGQHHPTFREVVRGVLLVGQNNNAGRKYCHTSAEGGGYLRFQNNLDELLNINAIERTKQASLRMMRSFTQSIPRSREKG